MHSCNLYKFLSIAHYTVSTQVSIQLKLTKLGSVIVESDKHRVGCLWCVTYSNSSRRVLIFFVSVPLRVTTKATYFVHIPPLGARPWVTKPFLLPSVILLNLSLKVPLCASKIGYPLWLGVQFSVCRPIQRLPSDESTAPFSPTT